MINSEVPEEEDVTRRVSERLTVALESRLRELSNLEKERLSRFLPLAREIAEEEPTLLAMLLDDIYHTMQHGKQSAPEAQDFGSDRAEKPGGDRRGDSRRGRRR